jgi:hypothetical protein
LPPPTPNGQAARNEADAQKYAIDTQTEALTSQIQALGKALPSVSPGVIVEFLLESRRLENLRAVAQGENKQVVVVVVVVMIMMMMMLMVVMVVMVVVVVVVVVIVITVVATTMMIIVVMMMMMVVVTTTDYGVGCQLLRFTAPRWLLGSSLWIPTSVVAAPPP